MLLTRTMTPEANTYVSLLLIKENNKPQGYTTFSMLNSAEHEILQDNK